MYICLKTLFILKMKLEKVLKDSFSGYAKKLTILSTLKMEFHCFLACIFAMEKSDVSLIVAVLWFISVFPPDTFKIFYLSFNFTVLHLGAEFCSYTLLWICASASKNSCFSSIFYDSQLLTLSMLPLPHPHPYLICELQLITR